MPPAGGFHNTDIMSQCSGGRKPEIKVWTGVVPSEGCEETSVPCSLPDSGGLLTISEVPCLVAGVLPVRSHRLSSTCALFSAHGILFIKTSFILD